MPKLAVEGSNLFGLIVILLLARRIKALLQKRSSLKSQAKAFIFDWLKNSLLQEHSEHY